MAFRTKLDFSSNRQVKQRIETLTVLSGGTSFGVPFNLLPTGPNLTTTGVTYSSTTVLSTFSGNSATTVYTWYDPFMESASPSLLPITPATSAITQNVIGFSATSYTTIDGNTVATAYSGVSFDLTPISVIDLGGGNYIGSVQSDLVEYLSASTLDFTGRTIWVDVSGITRTEDLIITKNPVIGNVWTCIDAEGKGGWSPSSGSTGSSGTSLYWYSENATPPTISPVATGIGSIALGDGAKALGDDMFVYGYGAGNNTTYSDFSNFIGFNAGTNSNYSIGSNFIGFNAGINSISGDSANFIGFNAGYSTFNSYFTNFIGPSAGFQAYDSYQSNFIGLNAGYQTDSSYNSNFIGSNAGSLSTNAIGSNFIGRNSGYQSTSANDSNFIGTSAGWQSSNSFDSNFIGRFAGYQATDSNESNFMGYAAGNGATGANNSNFMGYNAGQLATGANGSNFFGPQAGNGATGANNSNFIGSFAGYGAISVIYSNFFGINAGVGAINASQSNFFGGASGQNATGATNSNFFGYQAGDGAINSIFSNFFGNGAGRSATDATNSNFFGPQAGVNAKNASYSNFIGEGAGTQATGSSYSNFIGQGAGSGVTNSNYSNLIGHKVGKFFTSNNIGSNNIIIGTNISLPNATTNSINIGGVLFGVNTYSTTTGNPSITPNASGKIGIGVVTPTEGLDVALNGRFRTIGSSASAGALHYDTNGVLTTSTSDGRLKSNIEQLTNSLDKIKQLRGVKYNWNENLTGQTRIGFIAQEVEAVIPELTFINNYSPEKYMGVHYDNVTALLVEAVKELASGLTNTSYLETQTILAEDNNIELNYSGTPATALGGGISVLHGMGVDLSSELVIDVNGNWVTNNDFIPNKITLPAYTPSGSTDTNGNLGNVTRDDDYLYIRTNSGWKRTNLENF
jgi:hypothetical protein